MSCFYVSARLTCPSVCWSMVFGSRHSCLEFRFRVGVRALALHVLSRFGSMRSQVCSATCSSVHECCDLCCCPQFVFYRLRAFMLCLVQCGTQLVNFIGCVLSCFMSCVNTWLMSFLISCVFVSCFTHGW